MSSIESIASDDAADTPLFCPLCNYNLRGLVDPRCPECGYEFDWEDLRDRTRRLHPYLFEHHPERNVRAIVRTFFASLLPRRFWKSVQPRHVPNGARLLLYWMIFIAITAMLFASRVAVSTYQVHLANVRSQGTAIRWLRPGDLTYILSKYPTTQAWVESQYPTFPSWGVIAYVLTGYPLQQWIMLASLTLLWPCVTFAGLMVFQISLRRAKIRPVHVLRCVIYSSDAFIVTSITAATALLTEVWAVATNANSWPAWYRRFPDGGLAALLLALVVLLTYRLWMAYRLYLRFHQALATVIASQVIAWVLIVKIALDVGWIR